VVIICTPEDIANYHCPRWYELPDIDLYMDQVISILEKHLAIFNDNEDSKIITPTMVNNYVKQKIISRPVNKKYKRAHIAFLYVVCTLKKLMGLSEIHGTKEKFLNYYSYEDGYNKFCEIFENSLKTTFKIENVEPLPYEDINEIIIIKSVTMSFANILYARYLISKINEGD